MAIPIRPGQRASSSNPIAATITRRSVSAKQKHHGRSNHGRYQRTDSIDLDRVDEGGLDRHSQVDRHGDDHVAHY